MLMLATKSAPAKGAAARADSISPSTSASMLRSARSAAPFSLAGSVLVFNICRPCHSGSEAILNKMARPKVEAAPVTSNDPRNCLGRDGLVEQLGQVSLGAIADGRI